MAVRDADVLICFGAALHEFAGSEDGLEGLYAELFALDAELIAALPRTNPYTARCVETITDEDRTDGYKLMVLRVAVTGQGQAA